MRLLAPILTLVLFAHLCPAANRRDDLSGTITAAAFANLTAYHVELGVVLENTSDGPVDLEYVPHADIHITLKRRDTSETIAGPGGGSFGGVPLELSVPARSKLRWVVSSAPKPTDPTRPRFITLSAGPRTWRFLPSETDNVLIDMKLTGVLKSNPTRTIMIANFRDIPIATAQANE